MTNIFEFENPFPLLQDELAFDGIATDSVY